PRSQCCASNVLDFPLCRVTEENVTEVVSGRFEQASWATVSSFKGLENDFIILTDITNLESDWWRSVVYVGMSRARVRLHLVLPSALRAAYETRLKSWIEKHSASHVNES